MNTSTEQTLSYYDENADDFIEATANVEFSALQGRFASMLPAGGRILDLGCGSGRDSLAFLNAGFTVDAVDGSAAMAKAATNLTGLSVACALFDKYEPIGDYDGIWACSSLLHVPAKDLPAIIKEYASCLRRNGIFYMSFKLGNFEGLRNGRWFTDLDQKSFSEIVSGIEELRIESVDVSSDVRPGRENEKWLNAWCIRN